MRPRGRLSLLIAYTGLVFALDVSVLSAQVPVAASDPPDSEFHHLECYKVKGDPRSTFQFDLISNDKDFLPAHTREKGCRLRQNAFELCVDTRTRNIGSAPPGDGPRECADGTPCITDADCLVLGSQAGFCSTAVRTSAYGHIPNAWSYVCYKMQCDALSRPGLGLTRVVNDRFGEHTLKIKRSWKLCVPVLDKQRTQ